MFRKLIIKIKCNLGFHYWGSFWKDGWIQPQMKTKHFQDGFTKECRICTYCGHTQYKDATDED